MQKQKQSPVFLVAFVLLVWFSFTDSSAAQVRVQNWIKLDTNYYDLYPRRESVFLQKMDRLTNGVGMLLTLRSSMPALDHFEYSINTGPVRSSKSQVEFAFEDLHLPKIYRSTAAIRAISVSGAISQNYNISVNYYPPELYAASGMTSAGYVIIQNTDLSLTRTLVEDWVVDSPGAADVAFAQATWGKLVTSGQPDYENARSIIRAILTSLNTHMGIPSDQMPKLSPFDQYRRAMSGADRVWCSNIQSIFTYACNSLGIPARIVGMIRYGPPTPDGVIGPTLMFADGHQTTEIFSESLNAWVWIDNTFNILGGNQGAGGPVTIAEFHRLFNDPIRAKELTILVYDPVTGTTSTVPVLASNQLTALRSYYKRDQEFYYLGWVTR